MKSVYSSLSYEVQIQSEKNLLADSVGEESA